MSTIGKMSDWDSNETKVNSGIGGGFGRGLGIGRGFGRSREIFNDVEPVVGSKPGFGGGDSADSGFGKSSGFGSAAANGDDGGWAESKPTTQGFSSGGSGGFGKSSGGFSKDNDSGFGSRSSGGGRGGFGSSGGGGGFGKKSFGSEDNGTNDSGGGGGFGSGFGSRSNDDEVPRGGGFGGGRSDKKGGCYKCGEDGHMARDCTSSGGSSRGGFGGGGGRGGFGGGGGSKGGGGNCFKCGEEGHFSRECPNADSGKGRGGGGACFKCGEEGHFSRECPNPDSGKGRGGACFKCGEEGHFSRECPNPDSGKGRGGGACFKCGEEGHFSRECPNSEDGGDRNKGCFKCKEEGHMARDCPNPEPEGAERREIYIPPPPPEDEAEIFTSISKGIHFDDYEKIPVDCTGRDAPKRGISCFDEEPIHEIILDNVKKSKYEQPTPIQKYAIPAIMKGRDIMGCAQTGSGKTAAFLLPVLTGMIKNGIKGGAFDEVQEPQAVCVAPTRELALQIYHDARKFSYGTMIRPVVVYGGPSVGYQLKEVSKGAHIVVGTPGRLLDFISKGKISLSNVKYLIMDEADRMLDMGFEKDMRRMIETMGMPVKTERQTLMFSATFPEEIQKLAADFLNDYIFITVGRVGGANRDIEQFLYEIPKQQKREKLLSILNERGDDKILIFCEQKRMADFLATLLSQKNYPSTSIHGNRLQREREEALRDFKTGKAPILVATSVAARGLDIPGVNHVINYDLPKAIDEYVHRIGRTGRCGNIGKATSFYDSSQDSDITRGLVKVLSDVQQEVPEWLEEASQTADFSSGGGVSYGSRDSRKGKFGGGGGGEDDWGGNSGAGGSSGMGGMAQPSFGNEEEESWD